MKTLRFLLLVVFALSVFASPVYAQSGGEVGYVVLVDANSTAPLVLQAKDAFRGMRFALNKAQDAGIVLSYEENLHRGILKIEFAAGAKPTQFAGRTVYDDIYAALDAARAATGTPEVSAAPGYNPQFYIRRGDSCVDVFGLLPNSDYVKSTLYAPNGNALASTKRKADSDGRLGACFNYGIYKGYKVTFNIYSSTNVLKNTYSSTFPAFSMTKFDKSNSIVSGTGPAGRSYSITWYHSNLDASNSYLEVTKTGVISPTRAWFVDFGTKKFRGGDDFDATLRQNRFYYTIGSETPYASCDLGDNECDLYGDPSVRTAKMSIARNGLRHDINGQFEDHGDHGHFYGYLFDSAGLPILLKPGDVVSGTNLAPYALPRLTAGVNYATDVVSGKAPANHYVGMYIYGYDPISYTGWGHSVWVKANASGVYSVDMASLFSRDIISSDEIYIEIYHEHPVTGNETYYEKVIPAN